MSENKFGGKLEPTQSQPRMARLGETLPERVTHEQLRAQALGPFRYQAVAPTQPGIPGGPGVPIAAAPALPTPPPRNVKA
jgi:hypothetical protein